MLIQDLPRSLAPPATPLVRQTAAFLLRRASRLLARLARRLVLAERRPHIEPMIEFYAEAGAPEGALYVNGVLFAHLSGVSRL